MSPPPMSLAPRFILMIGIDTIRDHSSQMSRMGDEKAEFSKE
jgi:hypothetical protein